ncbi:MAG: hypothetical protein EOM03_01335 [Clostridia bacterium]|nr:hypothetical protein [Clostridia bacterium]
MERGRTAAEVPFHERLWSSSAARTATTRPGSKKHEKYEKHEKYKKYEKHEKHEKYDKNSTNPG